VTNVFVILGFLGFFYCQWMNFLYLLTLCQKVNVVRQQGYQVGSRKRFQYCIKGKAVLPQCKKHFPCESALSCWQSKSSCLKPCASTKTVPAGRGRAKVLSSGTIPAWKSLPTQDKWENQRASLQLTAQTQNQNSHLFLLHCTFLIRSLHGEINNMEAKKCETFYLTF
jgi:hypothetical protein